MSNKSPGRSSRMVCRGAFTLVELLVVIGIIAVLIGILLPALGAPCAQARSVVCMANLRSIGQTIAIYTVQSKGTLPFGYFDGYGINPVTHLAVTPADGINNHASKWPSLLLSTLNPKYDATYNGSKTTGADQAKMRDAFFCPEVPGIAADNHNGNTHYLCHPRLMPYVGGKAPFVGGIILTPYKVSRIKRASEMALIYDGSMQFDPTSNCFGPAWDIPISDHMDHFRFYDPNTNLLTANLGTLTLDSSIDLTPQNGVLANLNSDGIGDPTSANPPGYVNTQTIRFRHMNNTTANVLMVDGHVESFKINSIARTNPADPNASSFKRRNFYLDN